MNRRRIRRASWPPALLAISVLLLVSLSWSPVPAEADDAVVSEDGSEAKAKTVEGESLRPSASELHRVDDGEPETGYGFVPSAEWGEVVQRFDLGGEPQAIGQICACWLKKRGDREVEFEVRAYPDQGGRPGNEPSWKGAAKVTVEAVERSEMGAIDCVDVRGLVVEGPVFLGVRWHPGDEAYTFVCADHSEETPLVPGFYREDRARGWVANDSAPDPNFIGHRALILWPVVTTAPVRLEIEASSPPSPDP